MENNPSTAQRSATAGMVPEPPLDNLCPPPAVYLGYLFTAALLWYAVLVLFRRTPLRCLRFLMLACALLLLAIVGVVQRIAGCCKVLATTPYPSLQDMAGGISFAYDEYWWMLMASVVAIPLGIYWTIRAYGDGLLAIKDALEEEEDARTPAEDK